jgi:hypothetical protein
MVPRRVNGAHSLAMPKWQICGAASPGLIADARGSSEGESASQGNRFPALPVDGEQTKEAGMKMFAWIFAAAISLMSLPALAGSPATDGSIVLTGAQFCVGAGCGDRDDWRWRHHHGYGWDRGGCRDVTVREHRDGEVVVRHTRRCD